jgi:hypothetical protein
MSDEHIQSARPAVSSAGEAATNREAIVDQLMRRVESLEDEKRRWKGLFLGAGCLLLLLLMGGGLFIAGTSAVWYRSARLQQEAELRALEQQMAAQRAAVEAQRQQQIAEEMRRAQMDAEKDK